MKSWQTVLFAVSLFILCILKIAGVITTQYEFLNFIEMLTAMILLVLADIQDKLDKLNNKKY